MAHSEIDDRYFLHHAFDVARDVRIRVMGILPCGHTGCACKDRPMPLLYFAKPDDDFDEWVMVLGRGDDRQNEADGLVEDIWLDDENAANLEGLAALIGAPWSTLIADPGYVSRCHDSAAKTLGDQGFMLLRAHGAAAVRANQSMISEMWG